MPQTEFKLSIAKLFGWYYIFKYFTVRTYYGFSEIFFHHNRDVKIFCEFEWQYNC